MFLLLFWKLFLLAKMEFEKLFRIKTQYPISKLARPLYFPADYLP